MTARRIQDPDVQMLATISEQLEADYLGGEEQWEGSPFAWIRTRPSRQVGTVGERLVSGLLAARDFDVTRSPDSDADRLVNGHRVEIKFSTLWRSGVYKFQQLRDQDYEYAICLGVSPFDAHCWVLPKHVILSETGSAEGLSHQHGGASGRDTAWLSIPADDPPQWLAPHGGSLHAGLRVLAAYIAEGERA